MTVARFKLTTWVAAASLTMTVTASASAQDYVPVHPMGTPEMMHLYAMGSAMDYAASEGADKVVRSSKRPAAVTAADAVRLDYRSVPARTRTNIAAFAAKSREVDPKGAAAMEQLFASQDIMGLVEREMRKVGLTKNNVADAYTAWWTNAWLATQGRDDTLPRAQMQAVKRQAEAALLAAPEVGRLNDAQKQEFAEALLIQAMLIGSSVEVAKEQGTDMGPLKAAVAKGARATGLDLSSMTLTDEGFVPVRTGDASGSVAVAEKALAANDDQSGPGNNDRSGSVGSYALAAAAGGVGVLGIYLLGQRAGRKG